MEKEEFKLGDILMSKDGSVFMYNGIIHVQTHDGEPLIRGCYTFYNNKQLGYIPNPTSDNTVFYSFDNVERASEDVIVKYKAELMREKDLIEQVSGIKPLDFVMTKDKGNYNIGLVTETKGLGGACAVAWIIKGSNMKEAWWNQNELHKVNNLLNLFTKGFAHSFGNIMDDEY